MTKSIKLYEIKKIQTDFPAVKITSSKDSADFMKQFYGDDIEVFESMFILCLNQAHKTIGYAKISQGGIAGTVVDIRLIAKYAIDNLAVSVIMAHNHPTGNLNPSQADIAITEKCKKGLKILDITLLDHIILTADSHYSLQDNGQL